MGARKTVGWQALTFRPLLPDDAVIGIAIRVIAGYN